MVPEAMKKIKNKKEKTILKVHRELVTAKNATVGITEMTLPVDHVEMTRSAVTKTSVGSLTGMDTILVRILMKILVDRLLHIDRVGGIQRNRERIRDNLHIIMVLEL
jgi:hypothetical protein